MYKYFFSFSKVFILFSFIFYSGLLFTQPVISDFNPKSGVVGTTVTVIGSGFSSAAFDNIVYFGGIRTPVTSATTGALQITVPTGMCHQPISVTTNSLTAYAKNTFAVTFPGSGGPIINGSFASGSNIATTGYPAGITLGDLDDDGKAELITANLIAGTVSVYKNNSAGTFSFINSQDFAVGSFPGQVVLADIDGDGRQDIIAANSSSKNVSVLRNTTAGAAISFAAKIDYNTISEAYGVGVADVDGDGRPEVVVATYQNGACVFRNVSSPGSVNMAPGIFFVAGGATAAVDLGDVNSDGKVDVIVTNESSNTVSVLRNTSTAGAVAFAPSVSFSMGANPYSIAVGDIDSDGKPDIVATNVNGSSVSVLRNNGTGTAVSFASKLDFATGLSPFRVLLANINGDDKPEIVTVNNAGNNLSILKNTSSSGSITFNPPTFFAAPNGVRNVAVGDLNNDSMPDVVSVSATANSIAFLRNKIGLPPAISSFSPNTGGQGMIVTIQGANLSAATAVSFGGVAAASFTIVSDNTITAVVGNGASGDVVVATPSGNVVFAGFVFTSPPSIVSFNPDKGPVGQRIKITGSGFGSNAADNIVYFGGAKAVINSASPTSLYVTVPKGATYDPLTVTTRNYTAASAKPFHVTFPGGAVSSSTFQKKVDVFVNYNEGPRNVVIADIDGDAKTDIISVSPYSGLSAFSVLRNTTVNGVVSFATRVNFGSTRPVALCVSDFNGDGKLDIALCHEWQSQISVYRNTSVPGTVSFAAPVWYPAGVYPERLTAGDVDGDGKPDIAIASNSTKHVSVFRNISTAAAISFTQQQVFASHSYNSSINIDDVDGDGKNDLLVNNLCNADSPATKFSVFRNTGTIGNISFAPRLDFTASWCYQFATMGDLDGDGKKEVILGKGDSPPNYITVFKNASTPGHVLFSDSSSFPLGAMSNIALNDIDGDGKIDLTATVLMGSGATAYVSVLRNQTAGNLSFAPSVNYPMGVSGQMGGVAVGDLDNDGKPDVAVVHDYTDRTMVFINQTFSDLSLCPNGNGSLVATNTGAVYQWQVNTGAGFTNLVNNSNYSGTNTPTLQLNTVPASWSGYQYRCFAGGTYSKITVLRFSNYRTGAVDNTWENPANWSCGTVPDNNTDVIINEGNIAINSDVVIRTLQLAPDAVLSVNTGYTLTVTR